MPRRRTLRGLPRPFPGCWLNRAWRNRYHRAWWKLKSRPGSKLRKVHAARQRARRELNPETYRQAVREWRARNPQKSRASVKRWQRRNRELVQLYKRRQYDRHHAPLHGGRANRCAYCGVRGRKARARLHRIERAKLQRGQFVPVQVWCCRVCLGPEPRAAQRRAA